MFLPSNITLKFGDSGDFVSELQRRLVAVSCFSAEGINGFYDGSTVNGVSQFQSMSGIRADGIAGPETLRRLNGVISGDTSTTDTKKAEEEARAQQEHMMRQQMAQQQLYEQQQALLVQQQQQAYEAQQAQMAQQQQPQQAYTAPAQHLPQAALPEVNYAQAPAQLQPAAYQQPPSPTPSAGDDILARMLLGQQTAQPQTAQQPSQPLQAQQPQQAYAAVPPAPPAMAIPTPAPLAPVAPQPAPLAAAPAPEANAALAQTAEPQRGMIGRAVQFVSEKMQQLHAYFESKLPSHVLNEVKAIGVVMAQSGVKEASIPTGPEPQRGIEGPQRGPQQGQQRG